jgi:hypothetical protein
MKMKRAGKKANRDKTPNVFYASFARAVSERSRNVGVSARQMGAGRGRTVLVFIERLG